MLAAAVAAPIAGAGARCESEPRHHPRANLKAASVLRDQVRTQSTFASSPSSAATDDADAQGWKESQAARAPEFIADRGRAQSANVMGTYQEMKARGGVPAGAVCRDDGLARPLYERLGTRRTFLSIAGWVAKDCDYRLPAAEPHRTPALPRRRSKCRRRQRGDDVFLAEEVLRAKEDIDVASDAARDRQFETA
jgi:hypothetical protein